jgi:hypothetical protein
MNTDLEDLLRQGIDRLPDEVPAGLAHRADRQARRHRLVTGAGVCAAVAAFTAAAVTIGMLGGTPSASKPTSTRPTSTKPTGGDVARSARPAQQPRPLPSWPPGPVTHATLVSRLERAVLTSKNYIAYTRRYNNRHRSRLIVSTWTYRNRHLLVWPHPHRAQLETSYRHSSTVKHVYYDMRRWNITRWPDNGIVPTDKNQCVGPADDYPLAGDPRWPAWLVSSLRCGAYTVTSHGRDHGTPILTIVNTPKDVEYQYGIRLRIRVDATTYLPVSQWQSGNLPAYDVIRWLPPTRARLAQLALPVPAGFTDPTQ